MDGSYEILISKINAFTRKFYLNKILRGLVYTLSAALVVYLLSFVLVYYFQPQPLVKTILFFSGLTLVLMLLVTTVIRPALAYFRLGKSLSLEQAATLIGTHFAPVRDKLLNTLQLKTLADLSPHQNQLIAAGIDQKIEELKIIPFNTAIRLSENKKYFKYFLIPLFLIISIGFIAPAILKEGTKSYVQYDKEIIPPAPFNFVLLNAGLSVTQGEDLKLAIQLVGDQFPQEIYLSEGLNTYKLEKENISQFHYTFKNLQKDLSFRISGGGYDSKVYYLKVNQRPSVINIQANLIYPAYLNRQPEKISNAGELTVPEGTIVKWSIATSHAKFLFFQIGGISKTLRPEDNQVGFQYKLSRTEQYKIAPQNQGAGAIDTITHHIEVIADEAPAIEVNEKADSISTKARYFTGQIRDDHGFSSLKFVYQVKGNSPALKRLWSAIAINKSQLQNSFFYYWNVKNLNLQPGQVLEYYFEVADNDGVNGPKITRSPVKTYAAPSLEQINKQLSNESNNLQQKMGSAIKLASQVEKDSKKIRESFLDKKSLSFEDKQEISQLLDKQKKLEDEVKKIQEDKKKNTYNQAENNAMKKELQDKQSQIDNLFNNVLDPKTKELLQKLQALIDQNNKGQVQDELSKMAADHKSLKNELNRVLELYKQLVFEQNLRDQIDRLKKLAQSQKDLSQQTASQKSVATELKKEQQKQMEALEAIKKELKRLDDKNQELERPNAFNAPEKELESLLQQQQQSVEKLAKNQQQQAAALQSKAAQKMNQIAEEMEKATEQTAEKESNINKDELRKLLQNLLQTSFSQEKVMLNLRKMTINDPQYNGQVQEQKQIRDNLKTIADSLYSLSKRIPQIESTVTEEMQQINFNMDKSLETLADRRKAEAGRAQQYAMASINNLALMLNEVLDQLEKNKNKQQSSGKGKGSMQQLQQMQQQLNQKMEQARQQMQKNENKGSVPKGSMSEEFARMAQQQQTIREALQKINQEENRDGKNSMGNLNQIIKDMKATEADLVNKKIELETIQRQRGLSTKLLEADQALREQDEKGERESKAGTNYPPSYQQQYNEYKKKQNSETEMIEKLPPALNHYYKNKITDYFKLLNLPR